MYVQFVHSSTLPSLCASTSHWGNSYSHLSDVENCRWPCDQSRICGGAANCMNWYSTFTLNTAATVEVIMGFLQKSHTAILG